MFNGLIKLEADHYTITIVDCEFKRRAQHPKKGETNEKQRETQEKENDILNNKMEKDPLWKENIRKVISDMVSCRKQIGLSQKALAEKIAIEQSVIGRFERTGRIPSLEFLYKIAEAMGMQIYPISIKNNVIKKVEKDELDLPKPKRERWKKDLANLISDLTVYRLKKIMTQADLAKKIGSTESAIARFEYLGRVPSIEYLYRVAAGLGVKLSPLTVYHVDHEKVRRIKFELSWYYLSDKDSYDINEPINCAESVEILKHYVSVSEKVKANKTAEPKDSTRKTVSTKKVKGRRESINADTSSRFLWFKQGKYGIA